MTNTPSERPAPVPNNVQLHVEAGTRRAEKQASKWQPPKRQRLVYANLVWMMSGFSCHSSFSTHICSPCQLRTIS